jgi:hypothetical protein
MARTWRKRIVVMAVVVVSVGVITALPRLLDSSGPVRAPSGSETDPTRAPRGSETACEGVELGPTDDLQSSLDSHPAGTRFCLAHGTYRLQASLVPKADQQLIGIGPEVVISGARLVDASKDGEFWVVTGQETLGTSEFDTEEQCRPVDGKDPEEMCIYRDQVFLEGESLWQVGSLEELSPGSFFWDYGANEIYLADDPGGRQLEVSVVAAAAIAGGPGVVIHGLIVEKFGNAVQSGAIQADADWTIVDSEIRLNHGGGVHMGPGTVLRRNYIHHNGQLGIHGGAGPCAKAKGMIAEGNEIAYNNAAGYNWGFEGGATKWVNTDGLVVRGNYVHHNYGMGLWTDGANINVLYEDNRVEDNHGMGIDHELGQSAIIRNNEVRRNGFAHPIQGSGWGAGIFIDQSRDVEVYGNVVEDNAAGITAVQEPAGALCGYPKSEVVNLHVHDNVVRQPADVAAGLKVLNELGVSYLEPPKNNRWENNTYRLGDPDRGSHFYWLDHTITADEWHSHGKDQGSRFEP